VRVAAIGYSTEVTPWRMANFTRLAASIPDRLSAGGAGRGMGRG